MKKDWDKLTVEEQRPFEDQAGLLLEKGYIQDNFGVEELAQMIYYRTK